MATSKQGIDYIWGKDYCLHTRIIITYLGVTEQPINILFFVLFFNLFYLLNSIYILDV